MSESFISFRDVKKIYKMGESLVKAVNGANFDIDKGKFTAIVGPSGAGKTTVLNLLGGMDTPTSGEILLDGNDISKFSSGRLTMYRRYDIGFVFQFYNLVQNLTAKENVELATQICKEKMDAETALNIVGLSERMSNFPAQLSGGEQQRVAIARAIAKKPKILLCDEPTGALDYITGKQILSILQKMAREENITVVVITHNTAICPMADRVIHIKNGVADKIEDNKETMNVEDIEW